jgi:hypothetical protein
MNKITRTNLALVATCKCGGVVAATMLYGGVDISKEFMSTVAEIYNDRGKIEIVNTAIIPVILSGCVCKKINTNLKSKIHE